MFIILYKKTFRAIFCAHFCACFHAILHAFLCSPSTFRAIFCAFWIFFVRSFVQLFRAILCARFCACSCLFCIFFALILLSWQVLVIVVHNVQFRQFQIPASSESSDPRTDSDPVLCFMLWTCSRSSNFSCFFFVFFCVLVRATFCGSFHGYLAKPNLCSRAVLDGFSTFWLVQVVVGVLAK